MTKQVKVGNVAIGGGAPVSIQSMTNTLTSDYEATIRQTEALAAAGAELVRVSVPDRESVVSLGKLVKNSPVPIIADIHYDHKLALASIEAGAHKIRVNPGNLGTEGVKEVAKLAAERRIPVRVGVNAGSLDGMRSARALAELACDNAKIFEDAGLSDLVLAVKCSDVRRTVAAYRELHAMCDYPLHIGLTEAGTATKGAIRSAVAIGALLLDGIGDTVRVSLAGDPVKEIAVAKDILRSAGLRSGARVVACPTCARTQIPVEELAEKVEYALSDVDFDLRVAVMGCAVNGIGESKDADIGVCGGKERSVLFMRGKQYKTVANSDVAEELKKMLEVYRG